MSLCFHFQILFFFIVASFWNFFFLLVTIGDSCYYIILVVDWCLVTVILSFFIVIGQWLLFVRIFSLSYRLYISVGISLFSFSFTGHIFLSELSFLSIGCIFLSGLLSRTILQAVFPHRRVGFLFRWFLLFDVIYLSITDFRVIASLSSHPAIIFWSCFRVPQEPPWLCPPLLASIRFFYDSRSATEDLHRYYNWVGCSILVCQYNHYQYRLMDNCNTR